MKKGSVSSRSSKFLNNNAINNESYTDRPSTTYQNSSRILNKEYSPDDMEKRYQ